jgi:FkbM family methyltransferase
MRKIIRDYLNKRGYEIIKQPYIGDKYPNLSKDKSVYYCETPAGNFYLPLKGLEKDAVAKTLSRGKLFEPEIIAVAKKFIKKGAAVLDIGANFGQMSVEFSKLTGEGKVYSFEAQNFVYNYLQKNIKANRCSNVQLFENAVWNKEGETLYFPEPDMNSTAPYSGNSVYTSLKSTSVQTITIDSLNILEPISFMKVDIEGADIFALEGAKQTILKNRMPIIFEYSQHMQEEFNTTLNNYVEFVNDINYKFEKVVLGINYLILPK